MSRDLVLEAKLARDVYGVNNTAGGSVAGLTRIKVQKYEAPTTIQSGSNFAAQAYARPDGTYTIAYRGTNNPFGQGDSVQNLDAILAGKWTPEMQQAVEFTFAAIKQVALEKGIRFKDAAKLFSVTGHSQGAFEGEVIAKLFGLTGSSFDGPGAARMVGSPGYRDAIAWVRAQELDAELDGPMRAFTARQYTVAVGGMNAHVEGVEVDRSLFPMFLQGVLLMRSPSSAASSLALQVGAIHKIDTIIALETARHVAPWIRLWVDLHNPESSPSRLASVIADKWALVQAANTKDTVSANDVHAIVDEFLRDQGGREVTIQESDRTLYARSSSGDTLILLPDGSGVSTASRDGVLEQRHDAKGGTLERVVRVQGDTEGRWRFEMVGTNYERRWTEDATGRMTQSVGWDFDEQGQPTGSSSGALQADGTWLTKFYDGEGRLLHEVAMQTFDDGTALEIKTEGGVQHMRSVVLRDDGSGAVQASAWTSLPGGPAGTPQTQHDNMYADMAGFVNALRGRDKVSQVLYAARIGIGYQRSLPGGAGDVTLGWLDNGVQALSAVAGVYAGLRALRSDDVKTQLGGAVGLLSSAQEACSQRRAVEVTTQGRRAREWGRAFTPRSRVRTSPVWGRRGLPPPRVMCLSARLPTVAARGMVARVGHLARRDARRS